MNSVTWIGFGFEELEKKFNTVEELYEFMNRDEIKPYVTKIVVNDMEFMRK